MAQKVSCWNNELRNMRHSWQQLLQEPFSDFFLKKSCSSTDDDDDYYDEISLCMESDVASVLLISDLADKF